jgi:hypothetical protein
MPCTFDHCAWTRSNTRKSATTYTEAVLSASLRTISLMRDSARSGSAM